MSYFNNTSYCPSATPEYSAELLEAVNVYLLIAQGIVVSGIAIVGGILTVSLMIFIVMNKALHTRTFILSLQLLALDFIFILFVHGPIIVTTIVQEWIFGSVLCIVTGMVSHLALYWRCSIVFVLTLDRFLIVFYPFSYRRIARSILLVNSIVFFILCFVLVTIPTFGIGCYKFSDAALFCINTGQCHTRKYLCYVTSAIGYGLLIILGGFIPVGMYIAMYIKARKIQSSIPQLGEFDGEDNSSYSEDHSNNQSAKVTVAILFVCLTFLTFPLYLRLILFPLFRNGFPYQYYIYYLLNDCFFSFPIADSVIIWRNKDIKDKFKKYLIFFSKYYNFG